MWHSPRHFTQQMIHSNLNHVYILYSFQGKILTIPYYDLQGRRLDGKPTQPGVYIYKGKKGFVKVSD